MAPDSTLFTITFVTNYIIDTPSFDVDTAAAFAAMQSIDFQQLSFFSGGILTVATTATFAEPAGPLTIPVSQTIPDYSTTFCCNHNCRATCRGEPGNSSMSVIIRLSAIKLQFRSNAGMCAERDMSCGSSSLNLGPPGRRPGGRIRHLNHF